MAKVAVLVPYREMCEIARPMLEGYPHIQTMCVEYATTDTISERARVLEAQGCELIISRGLHAQIIRPLVKIPVLEMRITAQELGSVVVDLKRELGVDHPRLALIGLRTCSAIPAVSTICSASSCGGTWWSIPTSCPPSPSKPPGRAA